MSLEQKRNTDEDLRQNRLRRGARETRPHVGDLNKG